MNDLARWFQEQPQWLVRAEGDLGAESLEALAVRRQALEARRAVLDQMRQAVQTYAEELHAASERVAHAENQARARAAVAAQAQAEADRQARWQKALAQRRQSPRVAMQAAIDLVSDSNFFTGFSTNVSEGGVFVATCQHLPHGTPVELKFTLPGSAPLCIHGVVRWSREVNDSTPDIFPGLGIQFTDMDPQALAAVHQFVAAREPLFFPD